MNLKTAIKRLNLFTQGQRLITIICVLIAVCAIAILYYTPSPLFMIPAGLVLNYILFRRLIVTNKFRTIITKSLRPMLWIAISLFYIYSVYIIGKTSPLLFILSVAVSSAVYGVICYLETQPQPNLLLDNILTLLFILVSSSLASLTVVYWHWPAALVMLILWIINFLIALWWLLDFTNKPQILAALWGFVAVQIFWVASRWTVLYQLPSVPLILSQYSAIITALAYGWGGIYYHYKQRTLKKGITIEYLAVTVIVFVLLIFMNRWTGTG
ncbi:hypothetical protein EXS66_00035 [Candidatus Saccharibacteria bacterium]|nr:hypothetical protein [Candidatus Saccharibacteria bacterium]